MRAVEVHQQELGVTLEFTLAGRVLRLVGHHVQEACEYALADAEGGGEGGQDTETVRGTAKF